MSLPASETTYDDDRPIPPVAKRGPSPEQRSVAAIFVAVVSLASFPLTLEAAQPSFAQRVKLTALDPSGGDTYGGAVDIGTGTAIVGAVGDDTLGSRAGAAFAIESDGSVTVLLAFDGAPSDEFGNAVAGAGDWIAVGAALDDDNGSSSGSVYLFERDTGGPGAWGFVKKLHADDADTGDRFGISLALDDSLLIVGADGDDELTLGAGAAYVFQRDQGGPSNWGLVKKLVASDAAADDSFGFDVALSGEWAIVGTHLDLVTASGAAYIFQRDEGGPSNWGETTKLTAFDGGDRFGADVDIDGDVAIVGAYLDDERGLDAGAAYLFLKDAGGPASWGLATKLTAIDPATAAQFGYSVAVDGDTALVGARLDDELGSSAGSVYVFRSDPGDPFDWAKIAKLITSDGDSFDNFGNAVALASGIALVGAEADGDLGPSAGSAYLFEEILVDPALNALGTCPGTTTIKLVGGTPERDAVLGYADGPGSVIIDFGLCAGTELGLSEINVLGSLPLDENGERSFTVELREIDCGLSIQVVDLVSCAPTNVTELP